MSKTSSFSTSHSWLLAILLTVLFVGLKLGGVGIVAAWSWWWIISPLLIVLSLQIVALLIAAMIFILLK